LQYLERKPHQPELVSILVKLEFGDVGSFGDRKTLGSRQEPTTNSIHIWLQAGIEARPCCWEANDHTTVPSLFP